MVCMGIRRVVCRVLVGKPEERSLPGRRNRGEGNIKMEIQELGWEGTDWIDLAQDWDKV